MKSGYRHGLRQAVAKLSLKLQVPAKFSTQTIDLWLRSALEADIENYSPILLFNVNDKSNHLEYFRRLLFTTTILLQDIKIPVFERIAIESIRHAETGINDVIAEFWFPDIENFSAQSLKTWIGVAHHLLIRVCETNGDHRALANDVETLHQQQFKPWLGRVSGGKSLIPILQAAFELGIPISSCGAGRYVLGWGHRSRIFDRSSNSMDSAIGAQISHRKDFAIQLMQQAGIPVPYGVVIHHHSPASDREVKHPPPWVVKPVDKDRGEGVTLGIEEPVLLERAINTALKLSTAALIEEQIPGTCHRILVVDGNVIFVVKRNPKSVYGDGQRSIKDLVEHHNAIIRKKIPVKRLPELVLDDLARACLAQYQLTENSVLAPNQKVALRPAQSSQWGGDPEVVTGMLHPANAEIAIRAAKLLGLNCAGVDLISTDISIPWFENGAAINEVNYAPVLGRTHPYQRSGTRAYLTTIFPEIGRIPIEVFIGSQAALPATQRYQALAHKGVKVVYCHDHGVLNHLRCTIPLAKACDTFTRVDMLRLNKELEHLIVHLDHDDSFLRRGLPFEYVSAVCAPTKDKLSSMQCYTLEILNQFAQHEQKK